MDCERFESVMLAELYGELDELTSAAAQRHIAGCARCSAIANGLRATRRVAAVPLIEAPADLEERILRAAERTWAAPAVRPRVARLISLAGSWAMRPQTAMAAVFLVMIGSSLLLLRSQSARAPASADVTVTEQGTPVPAATATQAATSGEPVRARPASPGLPEAKIEAKAAPASSARDAPSTGGGLAGASVATRSFAEAPGVAQAVDEEARSDAAFDAALRSYRAGRFAEAARAFDALGSADSNSPDLWAARAVRDGSGCRAAVIRFDKTAQRHKQSPAGWDALLEGGLCYRALGDFGLARARLNALLGVDSHRDRARAELDRIDQLEQAEASGGSPAAPKSLPSKSRASAAGAPAAAALPPPLGPSSPPASGAANSSR